MITVSSILRNYGDFKAVDDVSFKISPGEIVGLLGHNGAGKTTIMKMLTGFLEPTGGTILIDGEDIWGGRERVQKKIGYLPENCPAYPEMTILDYLDYSAALRGLSLSKRIPLIAEVIEQTGLTEKATQRISTLSRGYRQRTGVAQAILHKPKILILDEPTNGLDPTQISQMRKLIKKLAINSTIIISTHILQEVQAICDRVLILKDGVKVLDAKLNELQEESRLLLGVQGDVFQMQQYFTAFEEVSQCDRIHLDNDSLKTFALSIGKEGDRNKVAARIARGLHEQGWDLYSMGFESRNLETVFAELSA